ncbi:hypothetical protein LZ575_15245 [Antarcticibacterium sp. 1MA-6-2]|uniref:hypothetical protein n=1 Tax=Antarcticibacterium sp. 1MA-6-2 TaxID=2908210 RepID=UPI001F447708|nr:hypothetical protein [Antarcticibacterium sp. 1MA-6-2]UJH90227.1 hypothetical protein LZ575_15245 [Antarcticibacterium sp. 1MA-6-2]
MIRRKRDNLQEVIMYEEIVEKNDSILRLVEMTEPERLEYFTEYTNGLREVAIEEAKLGAMAEPVAEMPIARRPAGPPRLGNAGAPPALGAPVSNTFYFYNPARVATGMREFLAIWGPRELQDNWRIESGNIARGVEGGIDEVSELIIANNPQFNPQTYLERIPQDKRVVDSLQAQRNNSYYRLGLIYKEKFKENRLAAERLEGLLDYTSEERLVLLSFILPLSNLY